MNIDKLARSQRAIKKIVDDCDFVASVDYYGVLIKYNQITVLEDLARSCCQPMKHDSRENSVLYYWFEYCGVEFGVYVDHPLRELMSNE